MMGRRKKWNVDLLSGRTAALILLSVLFLIGGIAGCFFAGLIRDTGDVLADYLWGCLDQLSQSGISGRFLSVLWEIVRFPLLTVLLSFTALGVVGLPFLFAVRGFLLCYAISVFYRLFGAEGLILALVLFGLSAFIWLPVLLLLGRQGWLGAYGLLRRAMGDGRCPLGYNGRYFTCCGLCAAALCLCAGMEYLAVPILLQRITGAFFPG